jgi:hypothetical protein
MKRTRVQKERSYAAYHTFLSIAREALKNAEAQKNQPPWETVPHQALICLAFCSLALEALANAFGERLVDDWTDFERAGPIAKLRTILSTIGVSWNGKQEPLATAIWLARFRNKMAHPKPEAIRTDVMMSDPEFETHQYDWPLSKLEYHVSLANARRAMKQVQALLELLIEKTPSEKRPGLASDGYTALAISAP